jgi:lipopolysaccharide export system protein LptA
LPVTWAALVVACLAFPAAAQGTKDAGTAAQGANGGAADTGGLKLSSNEPIQIESDKLEVHQNENKAIFTGNVNVVQGKTLMKAGRMVVYYVKAKQDAAGQKGGDVQKTGDEAAKAGDKKDGGKAAPQEGAGGLIAGGSADIDHIEVDGKVYVKSEDQIATGDRGTFDMKSQILTLSGTQVVLTQGENVVVGCKLVANLKTGQSQLDGCGQSKSTPGRVKMLLAPTKKNGTE